MRSLCCSGHCNTNLATFGERLLEMPASAWTDGSVHGAASGSRRWAAFGLAVAPIAAIAILATLPPAAGFVFSGPLVWITAYPYIKSNF